MSTLAKPKIIYFVAGRIASAEDILKSQSVPMADVVMRNAHQVKEKDTLEDADGVMGAVPKKYADYPKAETAVKAYQKKLKALFDASGDVEAPVPTKPVETLPNIQEDEEEDAPKKTGKKKKS